MARPVLLIHSSGPQGPGEGSEPFARRVGEALGPEHELLFPKLHDADDPRHEPWAGAIEDALADLPEPGVVLGHSLGASTVLKHLPQSEQLDSIERLVLAATPVWGTEAEWSREYALADDWPTPLTELPPITFFHSRDDEEIPFDHLELWAKRIPSAETRPLDGCGHIYDRGDLTPIVEAIRAP
jgi:predicted alpha/beta hydrolase family esterase